MSRQSITAGKAVIVVELTDKATKQFAGVVNGLSSKMMSASRAFRDAATNAFGGGLLTGMAGGAVLKNFAKFEDIILNLTVKLGYFGNKTKEQVATVTDLKNTILELGQTTSFTADKVGEAAVALAQAGFSADEIKGSLQSVIDLAKGTNYSLTESADLVANLVRNFELFGATDSLDRRMKTSTELTSQLLKATRLGTIEIADLRESFKYAGGTAQVLGISVQELMGYFVQMSEAGLKGSLAGTSLNTMMLNMINNLDVIKSKFPSFNIIMKEGGGVDLAATSASIVKLTSSMNQLDKVKFFQDVFNIRGARAFTAAMEVDRVEAFTKSIRRAGAESRLAAIEMESKFGGATRRLFGALHVLGLEIGEAVTPEISALANAIAGVTRYSRQFVMENKALFLTLFAIPPVLIAIGAASLTLSFVLARLSVVVGGLQTGFKGIASVGKFMLGSIGGAAVAFNKPSAYAMQAAKVARMQKAMDLRMSAKGANLANIGKSKGMANLIHEGLLLQKMKATRFGLMSLSMGFLKFSTTLARFVFSWNAVGMALNFLLIFGDKIPVIANAFAALGRGIAGAISQISRIATYASPAFELLRIGFTAFKEGFSQTGFDAIGAAFQGVIAIIRNQLIAAWNVFMYNVEYVVVFFQQIYKSVEVIVRSLYHGLTNAASVLASPVMDAFGDIMGSFSGGSISGIVTSIIQGIDFFISGLFKAIIELNSILMEFLAKFQNAIGEVVSELPGLGGAGARIQQNARNNQSIYEVNASMAKARIEIERKRRAKEIEAIMNQDTGAMAAARAGTVNAANAGSGSWQELMGKQIAFLTQQLEQQMIERQAMIAEMQQEAAGQDPTRKLWGGAEAQAVGEAIIESVKAVTGGVSDTRAYLKSFKDGKEIEKEQLEELRGIKRAVVTGGGIG
jgi:TP901 family phage tail tape measure protein